MKLHCLIVDDEPLARTGIETYIRQTPYLVLAASAVDATDAKESLQEHPVDIIFLDVEMPGLTGIDFLKSLANPPIVIIISAYSNFAIEGFELEVLDYLVKPVTYERFLKATDRALEMYGMKKNSTDATYFFTKCNNRLEKINYTDILYVEARLNYVNIVTTSQKHLVYSGLSKIEEILPSWLFMKVHKSFIVAVNKIQAIEGNMVCIKDIKLPIGKNHKEKLFRQFVKRTNS